MQIKKKKISLVLSPSLRNTLPLEPCPQPPSPGQYPGQNRGSTALKIKLSTWFTTERLETFINLFRAGFSVLEFLDFFLKLKWLSSPPLVAALLIEPQGAESPGSGHIRVICTMVFLVI